MAQKFLSDIHATAGVKDSSGDLGTSGQVLSSTGSLTNWVNPTVGTTVIYKDAFTATNGQTAFTLANTVDSEDKTQVYIDGAYQSKGGYTVSGTTLTFDTGLETSSAVEVITFSTATANNAASAVKLDTFTGDGSDLTFVLSEAVVDEKVTQVYINGVYQNKSTYSIAADLVTLTFGSGNAPPNLSAIEVISFKTITSTDGTLTATTFLGDLNGTINTATTATTQSAGNNSTKISTTAYTDAKVADAINNGTTAIAPSQNAVFDALALKANLAGPTFTGTPAAPTASAGTNTTQLATTAFVTTGISNLIASADPALDTLNELATALNDDANFSTTVTNSIATKAPLASPTFSGTVGMNVAPASSRTLLVKGQGTSSSTAPFQVNDGNNADILVIKDDKSATFSGNVGINASDPVKTLDVRGQLAISNSSTSYYYIDRNDTDGNFEIKNDSDANLLTISSGGVITTGGSISNPFKITANPGTRSLKLVSASTNFGTWISWLRANETYEKAFLGFTSTSNDVFEINNRENADMTFHTNTTERLRISSGGKVGVGTTTMHQFFNIKSDSTSQSLINIATYDSSRTLNVGVVSSAGYVMMENAAALNIGTGGITRLTISSQGVVAVGTTPITDLFGAGGSNPFETFQVGGKAVIGSYKTATGTESMFANNIYVGSTHSTFQAVDATKNGSGVFCYSDRIDFIHATTAANGSQSVNTRARVRAAGGITTFKKPLQIMGTGNNDECIIVAAGNVGTFTQLLVTIPAMNNASGSNGFGGYSCEIYIAGYLYKYGHIMFGGYVNSSNYVGEVTILRSSGSFSASSASYQVQGMQFTVTFPGTVHPVGRVIFNKSGNGNTYPVDSITATFS